MEWRPHGLSGSPTVIARTTSFSSFGSGTAGLRLAAASATGGRRLASAVVVPIGSEVDVVSARQLGRALSSQAGFTSVDATLVATAISELSRNIMVYARRGEIALMIVREGARNGITVVASDKGPGIADVQRAIAGGYSTSGGLGLGLSGVRRVMDEFEVQSEIGKGTTVVVSRWKR